MIDGVKIKPLKVHKDVPDTKDKPKELGVLMEIVRDDDGILKKFGQSTVTITPVGTVKAFHLHEKQDDVWFVATGKVIVVLHDLRRGSPTYKETQVLEAGEDDYKVIMIPVGVAHGYKVIGNKPVIMFYHTTESYDPKNPDERRLPYDDPKIGFDWGKY